MIGIWIDGKPIYEKTVSVGALPNTAAKSVAHGIASLKHVISNYGYAYGGNATTSINLPYMQYSPNGVIMNADATNIEIQANANMSGYTVAYAVLQYTKTTD